MQIRYTIILFCVFTTIFVSCKDDKQTDSNAILKKVAEKYGDRVGNYKFTVQIPNDWIRTDTTIQGLKLTLIQKKKQDDHFGPNINVLDEFIGNRSPADYVKASQKYMVDNMPGITILENGEIDSANVKGIWYSYSKFKNGKTRDLIMYCITVNEVAFNFTCAVNQGGLIKYRQIFEQIAESVKIEN